MQSISIPQMSVANIFNSSLTMSSREIAELCNKRHPDVKRDIENMISQLNGDVSKFAHIYLDIQNREQTEYLLDKETTICLISGYNPVLRMKIIKRWQELEKGKVPSSFSEALLLAAHQAQLIEQQQYELTQAKPKVEFVDKYVDATGLKGFRQVCKLLKANENEFRLFLMDEKIMYRLGGQLTPYADHIEFGRFEVKTGLADNGHNYNTVKFTPKGIEWIAAKWAKHNLAKLD